MQGIQGTDDFCFGLLIPSRSNSSCINALFSQKRAFRAMLGYHLFPETPTLLADVVEDFSVIVKTKQFRSIWLRNRRWSCDEIFRCRDQNRSEKARYF